MESGESLVKGRTGANSLNGPFDRLCPISPHAGKIREKPLEANRKYARWGDPSPKGHGFNDLVQERAQLPQDFLDDRGRQRTDRLGAVGPPIEALRLVGQDGASDGEVRGQ
jgi:hypothetical protein